MSASPFRSRFVELYRPNVLLQRMPWVRSRLAQPNGGHPLNITLNGKTELAIDGTNAHILDDAGKDVKVPIVLKVARADQPAPDANKQK
jgi:hypothetical protein